MKNWRVVYTVNGATYTHDFETCDNACAWLNGAVQELKKRVTYVEVLELMDGEWARRYRWERAREW